MKVKSREFPKHLYLTCGKCEHYPVKYKVGRIHHDLVSKTMTGLSLKPFRGHEERLAERSRYTLTCPKCKLVESAASQSRYQEYIDLEADAERDRLIDLAEDREQENESHDITGHPMLY